MMVNEGDNHHVGMSHPPTDGPSTVPTKPMPGIFAGTSDRVLKASSKLLSSPYDQDSWNILIKDAQVCYSVMSFSVIFVRSSYFFLFLLSYFV